MERPAPLSPGMAWTLALAATATMSVSYIDRQAIAVLSPTLSTKLHISDGMFGWVFAAFSIAYLIGAPLGGRFIDRVGARRGLIGSVLVWSLVAGAHCLVPGVATLIVLRILLGAAEAPAFPAAAQTMARVLPLADRSAGFGILFTGSSVGAMIAPPLVTALDARYGWRLALLTSAVIGLAWLPLWLLVTRGSRVRAALEVRGPDPAATGAGAFRWRDLLLDPQVVRAVLLVLASAPTTCFVLLWGAKILVAVHHFDQRQVGGYLWLPPLLFDAGAVLLGGLATVRDRWWPSDRPQRTLVAISLALAVTVAGLALTRTPWQTTVLLGVALAGCGGLYSLLTADLLRRVAPSQIAAAGGLTAAAQSLAYIVASPLIGAVAQRTHSFNAIALALGAWIIPGGLVWLATGGAKRPLSAAEPAPSQR